LQQPQNHHKVAETSSKPAMINDVLDAVTLCNYDEDK